MEKNRINSFLQITLTFLGLCSSCISLSRGQSQFYCCPLNKEKSFKSRFLGKEKIVHYLSIYVTIFVYEDTLTDVHAMSAANTNLRPSL